MIVFSGANAPTTKVRFPKGEAVHYREHARSLGVAEEAILIETEATNTAENLTLTRALLCFHRKGRFWVQPGGHLDPGDVDPLAGEPTSVLTEELVGRAIHTAGDDLQYDGVKVGVRPRNATPISCVPAGTWSRMFRNRSCIFRAAGISPLSTARWSSSPPSESSNTFFPFTVTMRVFRYSSQYERSRLLSTESR